MPQFRSFCFATAICGLVIGFGKAHAAAPPAVDEIDRILQNAMTTGHLASLSIQVRQRGHVIFSKSAGFADLEQSVRATPEALYAIGSITKSMTSYCILTLVNEGKLKLDDRLSTVLPTYNGPGGQATIRQLLTHTSGIPDYAGDSAPDLIGDPTRPFSEQDVVALFADRPQVFSPGTNWQYSNSGYFLLGLVIEKVTGRSYGDVVHDLLLAPFGLTHVMLDYRQPLMINRVRGYTHGADGSFQNAPVYDATIALSAGAYRASIDDLTHYIELLFSDKVPSAIHTMMFTEIPLNDGTAISYRPSALVESELQGHKMFSHSGGIWGFRAHVSYMPADQLAIGLLTNTGDGPVSLADLDHKIARIVLSIPDPVVHDLPLSRKDGESYAGTYCLREILKSGNEVTMSYDGKAMFLARTVSGSAPSLTRLRNQGNGLFVSSEDNDASFLFTVGKNGAPTLLAERRPGGALSGSRCRH